MTTGLALTARRVAPEQMAPIRVLLAAAADDLTAKYGRGHWSDVRALRTLQDHARDKTVVAVEDGPDLVATFTVSDKRIPFYRAAWFADRKAPALYLTAMAVDPARQGHGVGRWCMARADELARAAGAHAVRLDAYTGPAGAGGFYRSCGYQLVHVGTLSLEVYEKLLA